MFSLTMVRGYSNKNFVYTFRKTSFPVMSQINIVNFTTMFYIVKVEITCYTYINDESCSTYLNLRF